MKYPQRIVIALGGNALQKEGEATASDQQTVASATARQLVPLIKEGCQLVIVHGNGPQVGDIVIHEEAVNTADVPTLPLDTCVAMSQGSIGYWLQKAFEGEFVREGMSHSIVTIVTQTLVDSKDPAFKDPSKPIGPFYATKEIAERAASRRGFIVKEDASRGWRRVVSSPKPLEIMEAKAIESLISNGMTVIAAGGGGIPVTRTRQGLLNGVEAVIDKDFSAAVVADMLNADSLIMLTAVDAAMINYGTPEQIAIREVDKLTMLDYVEAGYFAPGSMLPKVLAALKYLEKPNRTAVIASLDNAVEAVKQLSGTIIHS